MMNKLPMRYPRTVDGIEYRTFHDEGDPASYRLIELLLRSRPGSDLANAALGLKVTDAIMLIDHEAGGEFVPYVTDFSITSAFAGVVYGRLIRTTSDAIVPTGEPPHAFRHGYSRVPDLSGKMQSVSEPFMLSAITTLTPGEWSDARKAAIAKLRESQEISDNAATWINRVENPPLRQPNADE